MENPKFKKIFRLVFQGNIEIDSKATGEERYEELKRFLVSMNPQCMINGQLVELLEPCCKERNTNP